MAQEIKDQGTGFQIKFPGLKYIRFSYQIIRTANDYRCWLVGSRLLAMAYHCASFS
jgi:hypothetical protein